MACGDDTLGWIIGESTPERSTVIFNNSSLKNTRAGSYVVADSPEGCILGIVERLVAGSKLYPPDVSNPSLVDSVISSLGGYEGEYYLKGSIRWLSRVDDLKENRVMAPKYPPIPGTPVTSVDKGILEIVFSPNSREWVRIGRLEPSGVEYKVNVNRLSRHLAILAVTGGGKSNTVCVLARRLVEELNATIALFDMHGEYGDLGLGGRAHVWSPATVNPAALSLPELLQLVRLPSNAINQERILRWAWRNAIGMYKRREIRASEILDMTRQLVEWLQSTGGRTTRARIGGRQYEVDEPPRDPKPDQIQGVLNKLDDLLDYYSDVLNPELPLNLDMIIKPGHLTVFDLSSLDERGADAVASHYLRRILQERKTTRGGGRGYPKPLIVVVEEAHVLVPASDDTLTKYWASRIAREGRKFGVGLTLVSQRPKNVDPDVLSQTNNKIILRMVEPQDIRYIQVASEELSDDLTSLLPGLNPGEAVVIGSMTRLPALVKIDYCGQKYSGGDIDLVKEWRAEEEEDVLTEVF
ncbi:MAG: ATP-binding protein [Desulfurococcales archaeon]|nr:ATP-binding protein [Desulfurococcales archaeon]